MATAIVCGGRKYADADRIKAVLDAAVDRLGISEIIEGGASGADTLAREWAQSRDDISIIEVNADWLAGKQAGPLRNERMAAMKPDYVIAFPGGSGTASMVSIAKRRGITVHEIKG